MNDEVAPKEMRDSSANPLRVWEAMKRELRKYIALLEEMQINTLRRS